MDDQGLLTALLEAAVDAIIVADRTGAILRANPAAAALFRRKPGDLIGQNVRILMPDSMAARHDGFIEHHLSTGEKRIIGTGRDVEGLRGDGTVFPLHLTVGRTDIGGDVTFVAILHDQTRRHAAEEAAARSQRMDAIGRMTGGIAHDFNNLLTVVIGNLELLEMGETRDKARALIADALSAAELGADLTSRLMVFARKTPLASRLVDLNEALERSAALLRRTIGAHIRLDISAGEDLWQIKADPTQLQTAILNLALNSQDAMPAGGRIVLDTRNVVIDDTYVAQELDVAMGHYVRMSVSDTGEGMTPAQRDRALEPFFTTKETGKGTGLGLSMVYGFVKQSGGHLTIYSEPGQGTTIGLYFPALDTIELAETPPDTSEAALTDRSAGRTVLIVEDDAKVRRLSVTRLTALGFRCLTAANADEALKVLASNDTIALLFTDLVMPGALSGYDLAQRVTAEHPRIAILLTSGFSEGVLRDGSIGQEYDILRKPYRQADLVKAIYAVLGEG